MTKLRSARERPAALEHSSSPAERLSEKLDLREWLPYRCSVIANHVSACLENMYRKRFGLSVVGWRVMATLGSYAPLSGKEVAERTAMDSVRVTRTINHMSALGLISRRVDADDRRRIVLRLSKKGWRTYQEIVPIAKEIERSLLAGFSAEEIQVLDRLTEKLLERAEQILPTGVRWEKFNPEV